MTIRIYPKTWHDAVSILKDIAFVAHVANFQIVVKVLTETTD